MPILKIDLGLFPSCSLSFPLRPSLMHPYPRLQVITVRFISYLSELSCLPSCQLNISFGEIKSLQTTCSHDSPLNPFLLSNSVNRHQHPSLPISKNLWLSLDDSLWFTVHEVYQQVLCTGFRKPSSDPSSQYSMTIPHIQPRPAAM